MEDRKFGNINLYLWQLRARAFREMWEDSGMLFCCFDVTTKLIHYQWRCCGWLMSCLLRRFMLDGLHSFLKEDELLSELDARGIRYSTSTTIYRMTRRETKVQFSRSIVTIRSRPFHGYALQIQFLPYSYEVCIPLRLSRIGADDFVDCVLMMESLVGKVHDIVGDEYAGRLSKRKANRIRRISARHRRMQGKDIGNQESDEQYT